MGRLRIGILGAGQVAGKHLRALSSRNDCELVALYDPNRERAGALAAGVPGLEALCTAEAVVTADVDAVIITAPTQEHYTLGAAVLKAGKHVLMEKPFTRTAGEAERLGHLANRHGLVCMPAQIARFLPAVTALRERLSVIDPGALVQAVERRLTYRTEVYPWWQSIPEFLILHWGSHSLDIFLWLTGEETQDVCCWASSRQAGYDSVDDFTLVTQMRSGAVMTLHQTFTSREEVLDWLLIWQHGTALVDDLATLRWNSDTLVKQGREEAPEILPKK